MTSAGIVAYRLSPEPEVLLVHPGGPYFVKKDIGVWSIPKGEYTNENPLEVAKREFTEETGNVPPNDHYIELGCVQLKSGKLIYAWATCCNFDQPFISSNTFEIEWPPRSGLRVRFPEVDQAAWFKLPEARVKLNPAQVDFINRLEMMLQKV